MNLPLIFLLSTINLCHCVSIPLEEDFREDSTYTLSSALRNCIRREDGHFGNYLGCLKEGALAGLSNADTRECVEVLDGVTLLKERDDEGPLPRGLQSRGLIDAAAEFVGRRYLKWDMNDIHPGLFLKVGPMLDNSGFLEFVMEGDYSKHSDRTLSTGRILMRTFVLPLLLGVKVKLATLVPLLIIVLVFISKKALLLSNLTLFLAGFLGFKSLFTSQQQHQSVPGNSFMAAFPEIVTYHNGGDDNFYKDNFHKFPEPSYKIRETTEERSERKGARNFAWEK